MNQTEIKEIFQKYEALLNGHFLLSSGLHSDTYFQSALVLQYPKVAEKLAKELSKNILDLLKEKSFNVVVSPAIGGIIIGQEIARVLDIRAIFCERVDGKMVLRRGFKLNENDNAIIVEDVITTGLSTNEVITVVKSFGANVLGVASLVNRSSGKINISLPITSLLNIEIKNYKPEECPLCQKGIKIIKPGSRIFPT